MFGRSRACLLAFSLLILLPVAAPGQSERAEPGSDFVLPLLPPATSRPPGAASGSTVLPTAMANSSRHFWLAPTRSRRGDNFFRDRHCYSRRPGNPGQSVETVAVTFHVEQAIRGVIPSEDLTISQWIVLWSSGQRYRRGERVLLFLYSPSKLGLTSCSGGTMGRFAIDPRGRVMLSAQQLSAFRTDPVLGGKSRLHPSDFA